MPCSFVLAYRSVQHTNMFLNVLLAAVLSWTLYCTICLSANYVKARTLGVPLIIVPISGTNALWVLLEPWIWPVIECFPLAIADRLYYMRREWTFHDKQKTHERLGDYFVKVSPGQNMLYVSNSDIINDIFTRNKDFKRPVHFYSTRLYHRACSPAKRFLGVLDIFGKSVVTVRSPDPM